MNPLDEHTLALRVVPWRRIGVEAGTRQVLIMHDSF